MRAASYSTTVLVVQAGVLVLKTCAPGYGHVLNPMSKTTSSQGLRAVRRRRAGTARVLTKAQKRPAFHSESGAPGHVGSPSGAGERGSSGAPQRRTGATACRFCSTGKRKAGSSNETLLRASVVCHSLVYANTLSARTRGGESGGVGASPKSRDASLTQR